MPSKQGNRGEGSQIQKEKDSQEHTDSTEDEEQRKFHEDNPHRNKDIAVEADEGIGKEQAIVEKLEHESFDELRKTFANIALSAGQPSNTMVLSTNNDNPMMIMNIIAASRSWADLIKEPPRPKWGKPKKNNIYRGAPQFY